MIYLSLICGNDYMIVSRTLLMWISIEVYSEAQGGEQPHLSWTQQEKFGGASEFAWSK